MTEAEWLACAGPEGALRPLRGKVSDRKLRLFGVECCWLCDLLSGDHATRERLNVIERYTSGQATDAELQGVENRAWETASGYTAIGPESPEAGSAEWNERFEKGMAFEAVAFLATLPSSRGSLLDDIVAALDRLTSGTSFEFESRPLLHDIVGNPFRPVAFSLSWRTDTAVTLARQMYDSRDFSAMPILADALQDAGCDSDDILAHCRGPGPHVRGCWVCDLVLGKE
jgi:hypothetical protein